MNTTRPQFIVPRTALTGSFLVMTGLAISLLSGSFTVGAAAPLATPGTFANSSSGESFGDHARLFPLL